MVQLRIRRLKVEMILQVRRGIVESDQQTSRTVFSSDVCHLDTEHTLVSLIDSALTMIMSRVTCHGLCGVT